MWVCDSVYAGVAVPGGQAVSVEQRKVSKTHGLTLVYRKLCTCVRTLTCICMTCGGIEAHKVCQCLPIAHIYARV